MTHIWRIQMRKLSFTPSDRKRFSYLISCNSDTEVMACKFLRENWGSKTWWEETIIIDCEYVGELHEVSVLEMDKMFQKRLKGGGK